MALATWLSVIVTVVEDGVMICVPVLGPLSVAVNDRVSANVVTLINGTLTIADVWPTAKCTAYVGATELPCVPKSPCLSVLRVLRVGQIRQAAGGGERHVSGRSADVGSGAINLDRHGARRFIHRVRALIDGQATSLQDS